MRAFTPRLVWGVPGASEGMREAQKTASHEARVVPGIGSGRKTARGRSRLVLLFTLVLAACGFASSGSAAAACNNFSPPDYSDITAVGFLRQGCGGLVHERWAKRLRCSVYELVIWPQEQIAEYTQYDLADQQGTYKIAISLVTLQALLKRYAFFRIAPGEQYISDMNYTELTLKGGSPFDAQFDSRRIAFCARLLTAITPLDLMAAFSYGCLEPSAYAVILG